MSNCYILLLATKQREKAIPAYPPTAFEKGSSLPTSYENEASVSSAAASSSESAGVLSASIEHEVAKIHPAPKPILCDERDVLTALSAFDLYNSTPMEAFRCIEMWQQKIKGRSNT
jgi:pheromone shutdown protein TraB